MKKKVFYILLLNVFAVMFFAASCEKNNDAPDPGPTPNPDVEEPAMTEVIELPAMNIDGMQLLLDDNDTKAAQLSQKMALNIFSEIINSDDNESNSLFSPISLSFALAMTANGATGNTLDEMSKILGFQESDLKSINEYYYKTLTALPTLDSGIELSLANAVFVNKSKKLFPNYSQRLEKYYDAAIFYDDVNAENINNWVSEKTKGLIPELVDELKDVEVALLNALYFKGEWRNPKAVHDVIRDFNAASGRKMQGRYMSDEMFLTYENDCFDAAKAQIGPNHDKSLFRYVLILPKEGKTIGDALSSIQAIGWHNFISGFTDDWCYVSHPVFKVENKMELQAHLERMGMKDAFNPIVADFSNMMAEPMFISKILQGNSFMVDEYGISATSATEIEMMSAGFPEYTKVLVFDRPFIFALIEESSGAILYLGAINSLEII